MNYLKVDHSSENSSESDEEKMQPVDKGSHHEIKNIIKTLKHPSESQEFMEHLLS